jgi:hypothetical protein
MNGYGKLPDLGVSSARICFSPVPSGKTGSPEIITLTNNLPDPSTTRDKTATPASAITAPATPIKITKVVTSGPFSLEGFGDEVNLDRGKSLVLVVRFTPTTGGESSGMLTIFSSASTSPQDVYLFGSTPNPLSGLCNASPRCEIAIVALLCVVYWIVMVVVRWNRIAYPTREFLKTEINSLQAELETLASEQDQRVAAANEQAAKQGNAQPNQQPQPNSMEQTHEFRTGQIRGLIQNARDLMTGSGDPKDLTNHPAQSRLQRIATFLFWSRGQEMTGWGYIY